MILQFQRILSEVREFKTQQLGKFFQHAISVI